MEQNDLFSDLLNDPEKLQSAISMASSLLGGGGDDIAPPAGQAGGASLGADSYDPSAELMQKAMPVIAAIAQSGQQAVSPEKRNLLNAVKPFVTDNISAQIDHGLRLVSMARMARSAMKQLGGKTDGNGGTHV